MRFFLLIALISIFPILTYGQKLESNGLTVEFKNYEVTEQEVPMFGNQTVIMGTFIVKQGKKKIATHEFLVPIKKEELSHITVLDSKGERIFPRLHFISEEKAFTYNEGTVNEGKEFVKKSDSQKDIVLSGLLIWSKLKHKE